MRYPLWPDWKEDLKAAFVFSFVAAFVAVCAWQLHTAYETGIIHAPKRVYGPGRHLSLANDPDCFWFAVVAWHIYAFVAGAGFILMWGLRRWLSKLLSPLFLLSGLLVFGALAGSLAAFVTKY
jgi:hypothetical protein